MESGPKFRPWLSAPTRERKLEVLKKNKRKGLNFNLNKISESERIIVIKSAIEKKVDWDLENNIWLIPEKEIIGFAKLIIEAGKDVEKLADNLHLILSETKRKEVEELLEKLQPKIWVF